MMGIGPRPPAGASSGGSSSSSSGGTTQRIIIVDALPDIADAVDNGIYLQTSDESLWHAIPGTDADETITNTEADLVDANFKGEFNTNGTPPTSADDYYWSSSSLALNMRVANAAGTAWDALTNRSPLTINDFLPADHIWVGGNGGSGGQEVFAGSEAAQTWAEDNGLDLTKSLVYLNTDDDLISVVTRVVVTNTAGEDGEYMQIDDFEPLDISDLDELDAQPKLDDVLAVHITADDEQKKVTRRNLGTITLPGSNGVLPHPIYLGEVGREGNQIYIAENVLLVAHGAEGGWEPYGPALYLEEHPQPGETTVNYEHSGSFNNNEYYFNTAYRSFRVYLNTGGLTPGFYNLGTPLGWAGNHIDELSATAAIAGMTTAEVTAQPPIAEWGNDVYIVDPDEFVPADTAGHIELQWRVFHPIETHNPVSYYWGRGQTERLPYTLTDYGRSGTNTVRPRFKSDMPDESFHGGDERALLEWIDSDDVPSDADLYDGEVAADLELTRHFFSLPAGLWHLELEVYSGIAGDTVTGSSIRRVESGADDIQIYQSIGFANSFQQATGVATGPKSAFIIDTRELVTDGTEIFYFILENVDDITQANNTMFLRLENQA